MNEWISAKDRLPEIGKSVLVYQIDEDSPIDNNIYVAWIEKLGIENKPIWQYSWCCGCYVPHEVKYWKELPEPPK